MSSIFRAFRQSFESLLRLRMFLLILLPPVVAVLLVFILFIVFWQAWSVGLAAFLEGLTPFRWIQDTTGFQEFAAFSAVVFLILAFIPLAYLTAVFFTSVFIMPLVLKIVVDSNYKHLEKKRGGTIIGSLWNTLVATFVFIAAFIITLPLWLVPGCQVLIPLLLTAWLNKKVFLYDVLQDFASPEERKRIEKEEAGSLYGMGLLLGLISYIPLAFFLVPVLSALCYTYYGLNALMDRRGVET